MGTRTARSKAHRQVHTSQQVQARLAARPGDIEALYDWFDEILRAVGVDRAVEALSSFSNATGSYAPALVLGYCLFGVGRTDQGVEQFKVAYQRRPKEQTLYGLSGALLVTDRIDEAIALLVASDRHRKLATRPLVNLANAYAAKGEFAVASAALKRIGPSGRRHWKQLVESAEARVRPGPWRRTGYPRRSK